jgi:hypothetical protein
VIGSLAAVFRNAAAEFRELNHQRAVEQPLILQVLVKREEAVANRRHQRRIAAAARIALA